MKIENKKIVLVTGGFDPLHSGHVKLLNAASKLGERLVIGLNSDNWLIRKKGNFFLPISERKIIIKNLRMVDHVISWDDTDDSAIGAIELVLSQLNKNQEMVFANGGDRIESNIPEIKRFRNNKKVEFVFGIGGYNKMNSSSKILDSYIKSKTN